MKNKAQPGEFFGFGSDFPARDADVRALHEDLATVDDDTLESWIVGAKHQMDALHGRWLLAVAEYDRRQIADVRHTLSTTGWLRSALRFTSRLVRRAPH